MRPEVTASLCGLAANLVLGLYLVLGITPMTFLFHHIKEQQEEPPPSQESPLSRWPGYGFVACPIVTASVTVVQFLVLYLVYCHVLQLHAPAWGGWSWREVTVPGRLATYWHLYVPAALALASDFWRVAVIGTIAVRRLGEYQVAMFNTSYRIMWIVMILSNALATASSIKTAMRLGRGDVKGARRATYVGLGLAAAILAGLAGLVYYHIRALGRIFTNDHVLLDLLADAALPFTVTLLLMNFAVALERVPFSMGRTKEVFWYGFIASWAFQVPAVMIMTTYWRDDLVGLYTGMAIGYFVLVILYGAMVVQSDWEKYAADARQRSEMPVQRSS
jgi:multidrug resistance protein, MATE family